MNLKIREFKLSLETYIQETELPEEVKRMVLKEIYENAEIEANRCVREEWEDRENGKAGGGNE